MIIIINKATGKIIKNYGTNSAFPDGNLPGVEADDGQEIVRIHDNSPLATEIMSMRVRFKFNKARTKLINTETKQEIEAKNKASELKRKKQELNKIGYELLKELPDIIVEFLPLLKQMMSTLNIELTQEQEEIINKYANLKKEVEGGRRT